VTHAGDWRDSLADVVWYHTLELPGGIVTPGEYDLRGVPDQIPFPSSLAGQRCLDVGVRDGFWAFTMEQRGAVEVVGIDVQDERRLDWPYPVPDLQPARHNLDSRRSAFRTAATALESSVEHRDLSVYDLDPDDVGEFDFVFVGTILLHLRDPVAALAAIRKVCRGYVLINDVVSIALTVLRPKSPTAALMTLAEPFWWIPNVAALHRYARAAGFDVTSSSRRPYLIRNGPGRQHPPLRRRQAAGKVHRQLLMRRGSPHAWLTARPLR